MKNKYVVLSYDDSGYLGHIHCIVNTEAEAQRLENEFLGLIQLYSDYYKSVDPNKLTKEEWCNKYLQDLANRLDIDVDEMFTMIDNRYDISWVCKTVSKEKKD